MCILIYIDYGCFVSVSFAGRAGVGVNCDERLCRVELCFVYFI